MDKLALLILIIKLCLIGCVAFTLYRLIYLLFLVVLGINN